MIGTKTKSIINICLCSQGSIDNCNPVVSYMFHHFDTTNDSELNDDELDSIEHLRDVFCTDIFFQRCDHDGDHRVFSNEWCDCFQHAGKFFLYKVYVILLKAFTFL